MQHFLENCLSRSKRSNIPVIEKNETGGGAGDRPALSASTWGQEGSVARETGMHFMEEYCIARVTDMPCWRVVKRPKRSSQEGGDAPIKICENRKSVQKVASS